MKRIIVIFAVFFALSASTTFAQTNGTGQVKGGDAVVQKHGVWPSNGAYTVAGSQLWGSFTVKCHNAPGFEGHVITIFIPGGSTGELIEAVIRKFNNNDFLDLNRNTVDGADVCEFNFTIGKVPDIYGSVPGDKTRFVDGFIYTGGITILKNQKKTDCGY